MTIESCFGEVNHSFGQPSRQITHCGMNDSYPFFLLSSKPARVVLSEHIRAFPIPSFILQYIIPVVKVYYNILLLKYLKYFAVLQYNPPHILKEKKKRKWRRWWGLGVLGPFKRKNTIQSGIDFSRFLPNFKGKTIKLPDPFGFVEAILAVSSSLSCCYW